MKMKKLMTAGLVASAVSLAIVGAHDANAAKGKEKCYGVVKAGNNDCADANGKHSCVGYSKKDGDPNEWVSVPAGLCEKLVGGSLVAGQGGAHACEGKDGCEGKSGCEGKNGCEGKDG